MRLHQSVVMHNACHVVQHVHVWPLSAFLMRTLRKPGETGNRQTVSPAGPEQEARGGGLSGQCTCTEERWRGHLAGGTVGVRLAPSAVPGTQVSEVMGRERSNDVAAPGLTLT